MSAGSMHDHHSKEEAREVSMTANGAETGADQNTDYYAKGSAEAATECALTLAKIKHVSCVLFARF